MQKNNITQVILVFLNCLLVNMAFSQNCLKARYNMDGNGQDASSNGLHGTLKGTKKTTDHFGKINNALQFNGTSDHLILGSNFDYAQRSISVWVKIDEFPSTAGAIYACDNGSLTYGMTGITAVNVSGVNKIRFNIGANWQHFSNATTGTWYHLAFVVNSKHAKCFVNGNLIDSLPNNSFTKSNDGDIYAHLGSHRNGAYFFKGTMDDARIFDCAITNAEVLKIYNEKDDCLKAWYKCEGNAIDFTTNYNGTLSGTTPTIDNNGKADLALKFNGTSDFVNLGSSFDFPEKTINFLAKIEEFTTNGGAMYACDNADLSYGMTGITAVKVSGVNKIRFNIGANWQHFENALTNTWYQLSFVVNSTHAKCYVNGKLIDSLPNNSFLKSSDGTKFARLGTARNGGYNFKGSIDELKIWNCAMSNFEINKMYAHVDSKFKNTHTLEVFPNPCTSTLKVVIPNSSDFHNGIISIFSFDGRLIEEIKATQETMEINTKDLSNGIYFIKYFNSNISAVSKIIKL